MGTVSKRRDDKYKAFLRGLKSSSRIASRVQVSIPSTCGKICFPSKSRAKSAVRGAAGRGGSRRETKGLLVPYWCGTCEAWHIGHAEPTGDPRPEA